MSQYALSLPLPVSYSARHFFVSNCNREAWQWINAWPNWPGHALLLYGPPGSGKTHLAHIWTQQAQATRLDTAAVQSPPQTARPRWLIEDIETLDQEALLHVFNTAREQGGSLLLTAGTNPQTLPFTLPDLTSRLAAITQTAIGQPDDEVLAGALRKQFADRQLQLGDEVVAYVLPRMERSFAKVKELVDRLDSQALAAHKNLTVPFVKQLLEPV